MKYFQISEWGGRGGEIPPTGGNLKRNESSPENGRGLLWRLEGWADNKNWMRLPAITHRRIALTAERWTALSQLHCLFQTHFITINSKHVIENELLQNFNRKQLDLKRLLIMYSLL